MKMTLSAVVGVAIAAVAAVVGLTSLTRPAVLGADGDQMEFSAERAMEHIREISEEPHPTGSREIERVRSYITGALRSLNIPYEIQESAVAVTRGTSVVASSVKNIVARIPGANSGGAILLDAHYDTRSMTPGAADCSSGVATVLETARALEAGERLEHDVILLFTDNEEYGPGLGALAFIDHHPWAQDVKAVLNFEGLGATGPSILFEAGPNSRGLVAAWRRSASLPVGQSWFQEIYRLTPIGTDLNRFSDSEVPGLNFGNWAQGTVYHTALDNPGTIDPRSVQHTGSYALSLIRYLGSGELDGRLIGSGEATYFSLVRGLAVSYPASWALPLALVVAALVTGIALVGVRRGKLCLAGAAKGLLAAFLGTLISAGGATGIWMIAVRLVEEYQSMFTFRGSVYNGSLYLFAFAAFSVLVAVLLTKLFGRKSGTVDLTLGAVVFWCVLGIATSVVLPGFSYLFSWPALFAAGAITFVVLRRKDDSGSSFVLPLTLGAVPGVMLIVPAVYVMYHFAPSVMIGGVVFMISLVTGLLVPLWNTMVQRRWWIPVSVLSLVCVSLLISGGLTSRFSPERPRPNAIAYLQNEVDRTGYWFAAGPHPDDWTSQFVGSDPTRSTVGELMPLASSNDRFQVLSKPTQYAALEPPEVTVLDDTSSGGVRFVRLKVRSQRNAPVVTLEVEPYRAVRAATIAGRHIEPPESSRALWPLTYYAVPPEGMEVTLELDPEETILLQVSDRTWLVSPDVLRTAGPTTDRTDDMMRMPNFDYGTVVVTTARIEG